MEAARLIKSKNPHSMVEVKDLQSRDVTAVALRPRRGDAPRARRARLRAFGFRSRLLGRFA